MESILLVNSTQRLGLIDGVRDNPSFDEFGNMKTIHRAVYEALKSAWPDQAAEILTELKWSSLNGCYYFIRWGMFVGVETDGYIHT